MMSHIEKKYPVYKEDIDAGKIERELGWRPMESFETGLKKTVQWYLDNEKWWRRVLSGDYRLGRIGVKG